MRMGICFDLIEDAKKGFPMANQMKAFGFNFFETGLTSLAQATQEEYEQMKRGLAELHVPVPVCNNMFPKEIRITGPDMNKGAIREYLEKAFSRAAAIGVKKVVMGSDKSRGLPAGYSQDQGYADIIGMVRDCAVELCEKYDIMIVVEPLRNPPCNFINTLQDGMRVVYGVDHPKVRLLADTIHVMTSREDPEYLSQVKEYLFHVHVSDWDRALPEYGYSSELTAVLRAVKACGYDGDFSFEANAGTDEKSRQRALLLLKMKLGA